MRLAAKANLGEGTISDFENGYRMPNPRKLAAMRRAFEGAGVVFATRGPTLTQPRWR
ncbi:helix-turn-helix domain-containing protein [Mesorhizobium silamurunense]|uniref:helix-turn-helix domain-containing protein n=1 Tax=Mesorhizobium silamurunense TaxID=499528 RepID=UPI0028AD0A97|nr:helix-turn-helix transcriptional regulator [Mesorhizobium silamurunense]